MNTRTISLAALLIALGVAISPFTYFPVGPTRANPIQHMINALSGVLLGPLWAGIIALFIGVIRMSIGTGTIFAIPGGIPGGIVVGIFYIIFKRFIGRHRDMAALTEPIGTLLIGVPLSVYLVAPLIGSTAVLAVFAIGWGFSCIPGSILGFAILQVMKRAGSTTESFRGKKLAAPTKSKP